MILAPRTCPLCGRAMRLRTGRYGPFYGCVDYPGCRGTRQVNEEVDETTLDKNMKEQCEAWDRDNELNLED